MKSHLFFISCLVNKILAHKNLFQEGFIGVFLFYGYQKIVVKTDCQKEKKRL